MKNKNTSISETINKDNNLNFYKKNFKTLLVSRDREFQIFLQSFLASAFSRKKKSGVYVISEKKISNKFNQLLISLGLNKFIELKKYSISNLYIFFKSIIIFIPTLFKIKFIGLSWFINSYKVDNIYIGDLIYDAYIRYDLSFLKKNINLKFAIKIFTSILNFNLIKQILIKKKIKYIICEGGGYSNLSGLTARIASGLKINNISISYDRKSDFRLIDVKKLKTDSNAKGRKRNFKQNEILEYTKFLNKNDLDKFIKKRYQGKISTISTNKLDILNSNINKKKYTKKRLLKKVFKTDEINKKIVLIASHVFSDCPHLDGEIIFKDYYEHFVETVKHIKDKNLNNIYWLVKPHPSTKRYGEDDIAINFIKKLNFNNFGICPEDISTNNLTDICDNVITCTGTIALEFAIKGKLSINGGLTGYSKFGVTLDHYNKNSYFQTINNIAKIKSLNKKEVLFSKKLFYFFENFSTGVELSKSQFLNLANLDPNKKNNQNDIINQRVIKFLLKNKLSDDGMIKDLYNKI